MRTKTVFWYGTALFCMCVLVGSLTAAIPPEGTAVPEGPAVDVDMETSLYAGFVEKPDPGPGNAVEDETYEEVSFPDNGFSSFGVDLPGLQMTNVGKELPVRSLGHDLTPLRGGGGVLCAWTEADNPTFRTALSTLLGGAPVDYFDARVDTPSVALMGNYDAVLTWVNYAYLDTVLMGDNLADYVDLGGKAVLGQWCIYTGQTNWLEGRIMEPDYCPITADMVNFSTDCYAGDGVQCMHIGITDYCSDYRDHITGTQGIGMLDGTYTDGSPTFGYRPDMGVFYGAGFTALIYGTGEWAEVMANIVLLCTGDPLVGACCDEATGICNDDVAVMDCVGLRWEYDTLCAELDPPCGAQTAACCWGDEPPHYYECEADLPLAVCLALGESTTWHPGESCDDPTFECPGAPSYCDPCWTNTSDDWIANVTFAEINNTTGTEGAPCSYGDYRYLTAFASPGTSVPITVGVGTSPPGAWTQCVKVWVDWNQDYEFAPIGETYDLGCGSTSGQEVWWTSGSIFVPGDAFPGPTTMRVMEKYASAPTGPCESGSYGETEDYTVFIGEAQGACCIDMEPWCLEDVLEGDCDGTFLGHASVCSTLDCQPNGVPDNCDIATGTSLDCQPNGIPDECEEDCNDNGIPDDCDIESGYSEDCNENGVPDECDIADGTSWDVDGNGVPDECQEDCNENGILDICDISCDYGDCATIPGCGGSEDCQPDMIPDDCQVPPECSGRTGGDRDVIYQHDDGTHEDSIGLTAGGYVAWLNHFVTVEDGATITEIHISYGMVSAGTATTVILWSDPNQDGDPTDGQVLASVDSSVVDPDVDVFVVVDIPDTAVGEPGTHFFVGALIQHAAGQYPCAIDQGPSAVQSWIAGDGSVPLDPNNLGAAALPPGIIDGLGFPGNWLIRAVGAAGGPGVQDCNGNCIPDDCDIMYCDGSLWCQDCNDNGCPDEGDLPDNDCDGNFVPDDCQIADCAPGDYFCQDCDEDGVLDGCQLDGNDCNSDLIPDNCQLVDNDCNEDGVPDECQVPPICPDCPDCEPDGIPDDCADDCNDNGIPDFCDIRDCDVELPIEENYWCLDCQPDEIPDGCQIGWDCGSGPPSSGDCCYGHTYPDPGCEDPACEGSVCGYDSYCCDYSWDSYCASEAQADPNCNCDEGRNGGAILYAPTEADTPAFRADVSALTGAACDYYDARTGTPDMSLLSSYDVVLTWVNYAYADSVGMGNVLADYVDAGGMVILGQWTEYTGQSNWLQGRIMDFAEGYLPVDCTSRTSGTYSGDGTSCIHEGVVAYSAEYRDNCELIGDGLSDGTHTDGVLAQAYLPDFSVIYSPGHTGMYYTTGDWVLLTVNMVMNCAGAISGEDCNLNCIPDDCDISSGFSNDCNENDIPDECEPDCNGNEQADECDIDFGVSEDCNDDGIPDECEVPPLCEAGEYGFPEVCSEDCQPDIVPDECQLEDNDCNDNDVPDECDIDSGASEDCQDDGIPDECQLWMVPEICGNGWCTGAETCETCPEDCGPCPFCGDGECNGDETCETCPEDCGECPACADFVVIAPGSWSGSTCGMGNDCPNRTTEDVVYQVEILEAGQWDFSLCNSSFDTYLFVGDSDCCSQEIGAVDDSCGVQSNIVAIVDPGTYYVTIEGYSSCGNYVLDMVFLGAGPESDFFVDAPGTWSGTTCGAGNDCPNRASEDVTYAVTIPYDDTWHISLCDSSFDTYLFVGSGGVCSQDIDATDDDCGAQSETVAYLTAGEYYVDIEAYGSTTCGDYILDVFSEGRDTRDELWCQHVIPDDTGVGSTGLLATGSSIPHGFTAIDNFLLEGEIGSLITGVSWQTLYFGGATDCPGADYIEIRFYTQGGGGGGPGSGDCCIAHPTPGCEDPVCEASVCGYDSYCCMYAWDSICAGEAATDPNCDCGGGGGFDLVATYTDVPHTKGLNPRPSVFGTYPVYDFVGELDPPFMTDPDQEYWMAVLGDPSVGGCAGTYGWMASPDAPPGDLQYYQDTGSGFAMTDADLAFCLEGMPAGAPPNDCNENGIPDECDISMAFGPDFFCDPEVSECSTDCNYNYVPDECEEVPVEPYLYSMNIKGGACPAPFNRGSHGVTPIVLIGSEELDVMDVDISTLRLSRADGLGGELAPHEGPPGPHSTYGDWDSPFFPEESCECPPTDPEIDGIADIKMKFDSDLMAELLEMDDLLPGALVELKLTGYLNNGCAFVAYDCVRLVPQGAGEGMMHVVAARVQSRYELHHAWVDVAPLDLTLDGGGWTAFDRVYPETTIVTLRAEERKGDLWLVGWKVNDVLVTSDNTLFLTITGEEQTVTVVYEEAATEVLPEPSMPTDTLSP